MLNKKLKRAELYKAICMYGDELTPGDNYKGLFVSSDYAGCSVSKDIRAALETSYIHCIAAFDEDLLLCMSDMSIFILLKNGYAGLNGSIYSMDADCLAIIDKNFCISENNMEADTSSVKEIINSQIGSLKTMGCGFASALERQSKKEGLRLILQGLEIEEQRNAAI